MSVSKILVVDDFVPWHNFISEMFKSEADLQIISFAADGLKAVEKTEELRPDLILMDVTLPGINGLEATRQIRVVSPGSKVLFLSAHDNFDLVQAAFDAGASGYILKSDSYSDLILGARAVLLGQQFVSRSITNWRENTDSTG